MHGKHRKKIEGINIHTLLIRIVWKSGVSGLNLVNNTNGPWFIC